MKKLIILICTLFIVLVANVHAQEEVLSIHNQKETLLEKPKLVVAIVVDQMRYDYLTRFSAKFGDGGFKRLQAEGFNCKNNHFNSIPTYTGPGHASIFTGTTPSRHGIISNNWYDKNLETSVYCAGDSSVTPVGTLHKVGKKSPHRLKTTTFADQNRLFTQMRGKTIGISVKDRGAILPAGHTANAAYWFHGKTEGKFVSSSYYMEKLPEWVNRFNSLAKAESYLKEWNTLYDISTYTESGSDLNNFEEGFKGKKTATFPYDLKQLSALNKGYNILKDTPYGNSIVTDFALAALEGEQLGKDDYTDVLTVSYSSTDYVGHNFGVNSKELEDTYIRLDKDIKRVLNTLDAKVGPDNYTLFLTSDHGAIEVPAYLKSVNIPSGYFDYDAFKKRLKNEIILTYKAKSLIKNISNNQVFLDRDFIKRKGLHLAEVQQAIADQIMTYQKINSAYTATTMSRNEFNKGTASLMQNGFNHKRSGDVLFVLDPAVVYYYKTGSTHGSALNYDTHVPLLFFGQGINKGSTLSRTIASDIAPTISALLGISFPSGSTGNPLEMVLK